MFATYSMFMLEAVGGLCPMMIPAGGWCLTRHTIALIKHAVLLFGTPPVEPRRMLVVGGQAGRCARAWGAIESITRRRKMRATFRHW